ncbi:hypothetical protein SDC9_186002 [bioreactor metagenome]|uniref:Uncharacterized protein n=1 Tax=bioreactor metagenome TaxID=1076179 RepID=A0A645HHH0_9ZZZZ
MILSGLKAFGIAWPDVPLRHRVEKAVPLRCVPTLNGKVPGPPSPVGFAKKGGGNFFRVSAVTLMNSVFGAAILKNWCRFL